MKQFMALLGSMIAILAAPILPAEWYAVSLSDHCLVPGVIQAGEQFRVDAIAQFNYDGLPGVGGGWHNHGADFYKDGELIERNATYSMSITLDMMDESASDESGFVNYQLDAYSDTGFFQTAYHAIEVKAANWPTAKVLVNGLEYLGRIARKDGETTFATVRFIATANDNNLTSIRYVVWTPQNVIRETGIVAQSGGHGEVVLNVPLDEWGKWTFFMEAYDANGNRAPSEYYELWAAQPPGIIQCNAPDVIKKTERCSVSGRAKNAQSPPPFSSSERVSNVEVWIDGHYMAARYPSYPAGLSSSVAEFSFNFSVAGISPGHHMLHIRAYDVHGVMGLFSQALTIVDTEPAALHPVGPDRAYVNTPTAYVFPARDFKGDLRTQETYAAAPGAPFGIDENWWPNRQDFVISGSTASTERTLTFNTCGRWELHHRVSDSTGFYDWNASPNWSPILPVEVVNPVRNASLEWWGQHSVDVIPFEQRVVDGFGGKVFSPGDIVTMRGLCRDTDGIRDVEWIRIHVLSPSGQTIADLSSNRSDNINTDSDGWSSMDRSFTFPSGPNGFSTFTIRVITRMSGGETTRNYSCTLLTTDGSTPSSWKIIHGLDVNDPDIDSKDLSGDGLTNLDKYRLGLNPNVYNSGTSTLGNTVPAGWPALTGRDLSKSELVGSTKGELTVNKNGAATYSIPFHVAPGTAGMQPSVSLNYSSQSSSNIAGYGWSLSGFSTITRGPKTKAVDNEVHGVDFTYDDQYYLDGQRLIYIGGGSGHGTDNAEYRTESDKFSRIVAVGASGQGPMSFKVWTKAGWLLEFGDTANSQLPGNASGHHLEVQTWAVRRATDAYGNYMTYSYDVSYPGGEQYLSRINYTGKRKNTLEESQPYASLRFTYETRPDTTSSYIHGSKYSVTRRLASVSNWVSDTLVRSYSFSYIERQPSQRSLLASITESTPEGSLPPTTFDYTNPSDGWERDNRWAPPNKIDAFGNTVFVDINGDGRPDCVQYVEQGYGNILKFYFNTPSGWEEKPSLAMTPHNLFTLGEIRFVDLNADGLMDFMRLDGTAYINTGTGFAQSAYWSLGGAASSGPPGASMAFRSISFIDLNGDGRPECVVYGSAVDPYGAPATVCRVYVNRSSEGASGRWAGGVWIDAQEPPAATNAWEHMSRLAEMAAYGRRMCDLNGDGIPDFIGGILDYYNPNLPNVYAFKSLVYMGSSEDPRKSNSLLPVPADERFSLKVPTLIRDAETGMSQSPTELVDLNGDGLMDLVRKNPSFLNKGAPATGNEVWFNTGDGWVAADYMVELPRVDIARTRAPGGGSSPFHFVHDPTGVIFVDINNDGVVDTVTSTGDYYTDYIYLGRISGGWIRASSDWEFPWPIHYYAPLSIGQTHYPDNEAGSALLDLDGDGALDIVWNAGHSSGAAFNRRANPDRLEKVTDGFGVSHAITYAPLTDTAVYTLGEEHPACTQSEPITNITPSMHVVKTVTRDSDAPDSSSYNINYGYGGMRRHRFHGNLGFEWMSVTDTRTGVATVTEYSQLYPTIGMSVASWSRIYGQGYGSNGRLISESSTTLETLSLNDGKTHFTYLASVQTATYNPGDGTLLTCSTVTTDNYDSYGNASLVTTITGTGAEAVTIVVSNTYNNTVDSLSTATPRWHLGQLVAAVSTASSGSQSIVNKTVRTYDSNTGYLLTETLEPDAAPSGNLTLTTTFAYDPFGNRSVVTVAGAATSTARTTTTTYNTRGRLPVSVTNALGHTQTTSYDEILGVPVSTTDPNGLVTRWEHDSLGRVTKEIRPDGTVTVTAMRWASSSAPPGALTVVETESTGAVPAASFQDRHGRAIYAVSINPGTFDGRSRITGIHTDYDNRGRVTQTTIPAYLHCETGLPVTKNHYDALDRLVEVERAREEPDLDGWTTTWYAYPGRAIETTDPLGRTERAETDTLGRVIRRINNAGSSSGSMDRGEVTYAYDPLGRLKTTTVHSNDGSTHTTEVFYDTRGRRIAMDDPDVGAWTYAYNAFGELISQIDAKNQATTFAYDKLGRMVSRNDNDSGTVWSYDTMPGTGVSWKGALHRISHTADDEDDCIETFAYDNRGRLAAHTRVIENISYTTGYAYDGAGRLASTTYPSGFKVGNTYASGGWLKEIRAIGGLKPGYSGEVPANHLFWRADSHTAAGSIDAATFGNGLTYDRVINQYTGSVKAIHSYNPQTGDPVQDQAYFYDEVGQLTNRYDQVIGFDDDFQYDGLNRLTGYSAATSGDDSQLPSSVQTAMTIAYNALGNITYKSDVGSYAYNNPLHAHAVSRITTVPGQMGYAAPFSNYPLEFTYDANGNQLTGMGRANTWTAANKLRRIVQGGRATEFAFDSARQRTVQRESGGAKGSVVTIYASPIYEKVTTGGWLTEEKHYIMTPLGRTAVRTTTNDGYVETRYFHADGHGTIYAVTDEGANVEQRFYYDPWGRQIVIKNDRIPDSAGRQTRGYTDHEMLADHNLIHMNARLYDPITARFLSADRVVQDMGDSQTYNRYSYCANNPVNTSDPTGNVFEEWLYFGLNTGEIQEMIVEAYSQFKEDLRKKAATKAGGGGLTGSDGDAETKKDSLLEKGSNASVQAGKKSQSNGNNENTSGNAPISGGRNILEETQGVMRTAISNTNNKLSIPNDLEYAAFTYIDPKTGKVVAQEPYKGKRNSVIDMIDLAAKLPTGAIITGHYHTHGRTYSITINVDGETKSVWAEPGVVDPSIKNSQLRFSNADTSNFQDFRRRMDGVSSYSFGQPDKNYIQAADGRWFQVDPSFQRYLGMQNGEMLRMDQNYKSHPFK